MGLAVTAGIGPVARKVRAGPARKRAALDFARSVNCMNKKVDSFGKS